MTKKTNAVEKSEAAFRLLKVGTCPSLSNKSTLTYHVGCDAKSAVFLRLHSNTGGGFFNKDWISLDGIRQQLEKGKPAEPLTSFALYPIFRGRSQNSPSFLMAVLRKEGFVTDVKDKLRKYDRQEPTAFMAQVKALMAAKPLASTVTIPGTQKPEPPAVKGKPATPAKPVIKGKQYSAAKKPVAKGKKK